MAGSLKRKTRKVVINIVPLVDVLIVLIFFFLMTMQFRNVTTLNLTLPKIETAGQNKFDKNIIIEIGKDGTFLVNGTELKRNELEPALRGLKPVSDEITVLIRADEESMLKNLTFIMDACRQSGLDKIRLQSR
ncbi:MAG: biopolymer transporter ExbD [Opitutaceae bacterium]|nr:biopolymer transporter ExbD [Opitutaceae bacterium]|tara:strand:- start:253 stop:651 length:399 start_codon:yes stop_codon:yes gene_type:complete